MKILCAGDSRIAHPLLCDDGQYRSDIVDTFLFRSPLHHDIFGFTAPTTPVSTHNPQAIFSDIERVQIFTMALFNERYLSKVTEIFDLAIVFSGWHDWICPWPKSIWTEIAGDDFKDDNYIEHFNNGYARYLDKNSILKCLKRLKEVSKYQLFVGLHSIKHGTHLWNPNFYKPQEQHYADSLEMIDFFSSLDVDYLHLPMDDGWVNDNVRQSCWLHANDKGAEWFAVRFNNYIDILNKDIFLAIKPSDKLIVVGDAEISYKELVENSLTVGSYLSTLVKPKSVVLISKKTSLDQLYAFLGCLAYDIIPVIIQHPNNKVTTEQFQKKLNHIKESVHPSLCVCDDVFLDVYNKLFTAISCFEKVALLPRPEMNADDVAFLQLSSGTTGLPKVIEVTHKQLLWHISEYSKFIGFTKDDVVCSWLPLYHDMGMIACFMMPVVLGNTFVHINNFEWLSQPDKICNSIDKYGGTHVWMPNFAFVHMKNSVSYDGLKTIKQFISCSECTRSKDLQAFAKAYNVDISKFRNCYALAENIFAVSQSVDIHENNGVVSCGPILPGVSVLIYQDGKDITAEGTGSIYIKSSYEPKTNIHSEYGYYDTGDIGYVDNGELFVVGRSADKIKSYGEYVFPYAIEDYIATNVPEVIPGRVACVGLFDKGAGTEKIYVCVESEQNDSSGAIKTKIILGIKEVFNVSVCCFVVPAGWLIKTSSGKLSRTAIKEKLVHEVLYHSVIDVVKTILSRKQVNIEISEDLNLTNCFDSMELFEVLLALERLGVNTKQLTIHDLSDIKALRALC